MASKFAIKSVFEAVDKISAPMTKMQKRVGKFTHAAERGFRRVDSVMSEMRAGIFKGAMIIGGALAGVGVAIREVAKRADEMSKQAKILDMPIEELQQWQFVAEQSGISSEGLTKSLGLLSMNLGQAKAGTGTLVSILKKSNPQLLKQLMHVTNTAQAFDLVIKALRKIKDPMERAALARAAMGKQGLKAIVIAKTSVKQLAKLREEARKNGLITQAQATASEAFNDKLNSLKHTFQGLIQSALLPLMPLMTGYLTIVQKWLLAHKKLLQSDIKTFVIAVGKAVKFLVKHGKLILTVTAAFLGLMVVLRAFIVVMTAVNLVMDANPLGLIIIAVAALALGIAVIITHFKSFKNVLSEIWELFISINKVIASFITAPLHPFAKGLDFKSAITHFITGDTPHAQPAVLGSHARASNANTSTTTHKSEVTIVDKSNSAEVTKGGGAESGFKLIPSGIF